MYRISVPKYLDIFYSPYNQTRNTKSKPYSKLLSAPPITRSILFIIFFTFLLTLVFKEYLIGAAYFSYNSSKLIVYISSKKVSLCDGLIHDLYSAGFPFTPASYVTSFNFISQLI